MIIVVDFGSQTAHLIGRRLRHLGIETKYVDPENILKEITQDIKGIIFSGGPSSVYDYGAPTIDDKIFSKGIPILGICYGLQIMAYKMGGTVESAKKEYGPEKVKIILDNDLFKGLPSDMNVYMSHGDSVTKLPQGFGKIAETNNVNFTAIQDKARKFYGIQFHPEVKHTENGINIIKNFAVNICSGVEKPFVINPEIEIDKIRKQIGEKKVIFAVSGGVDSTVAAALVAKAIGNKLIPVYIESGLMREGTVERVTSIFQKLIPSDFVVVQAQEKFMNALQGISDPELKRKKIGKLYVDLFDEISAKHSDAEFLGQGTIYSDVIESKGSKNASNIKSHHNVGGLPKNIKFKLLEPLRNFYKDEVREIGRQIGLPEEIVMQQPFPGPGYGIRIRGEINPTRLIQVKMADSIVLEEFKNFNILDRVFQCFAVMTGAYSTAVKGDAREFSEVIAIRAYESDDIMTSKWADLPYELLNTIAKRIVNEVPSVSRVVYDITTKPPATMEWE